MHVFLPPPGGWNPTAHPLSEKHLGTRMSSELVFFQQFILPLPLLVGKRRRDLDFPEVFNAFPQLRLERLPFLANVWHTWAVL